MREEGLAGRGRRDSQGEGEGTRRVREEGLAGRGRRDSQGEGGSQGWGIG